MTKISESSGGMPANQPMTGSEGGASASQQQDARQFEEMMKAKKPATPAGQGPQGGPPQAPTLPRGFTPPKPGTFPGQTPGHPLGPDGKTDPRDPLGGQPLPQQPPRPRSPFDLLARGGLPQQPESKSGADAGQSTGPLGGEDPKPQEPGALPLQQGGERILSGMRPAGEGAPQAMETQGVDRGAQLSELAGKIANRILVSTPNSAGGQEVRITLNENILPGTEIVIKRDAGQVQIQFMVSNADSQQFLNDQRGNLQQLLHNKLGDGVQVEVRTQQSGQGGDSGDGRSRNQRNLYQEMQDNADD
jgi:type III secretion system needle length determinant